MNEQFEKFARDTLKTDLVKCTEAQQLLFKRMYSPSDLTKHIDSVVDDMPILKLDWAMTQVQRTLNKQETKK